MVAKKLEIEVKMTSELKEIKEILDGVVEKIDASEKRIRELEQAVETLREKLRGVTHKLSRTCCF